MWCVQYDVVQCDVGGYGVYSVLWCIMMWGMWCVQYDVVQCNVGGYGVYSVT